MAQSPGLLYEQSSHSPVYSENFYLNFTPLDNAKASCFFPSLFLTLFDTILWNQKPGGDVKTLLSFSNSSFKARSKDRVSLFVNCQTIFCCLGDVYVYMCFSTGLKNEYEFSNKINL